MAGRPIVLALLCTSLWALGCGGPEERTLPDESEDDVTSGSGGGSSRAGTHPVGREVDGSTWRWVEAHCTEGPLDLAARGFEQQLRVKADDEGLLLTYDQKFGDDCEQTIIQRARPAETQGEWQMTEDVRVSLPATEACEGRREAVRPGEVRKSGEFLEVLVQRSNWCSGLEVRMVYAPTEPVALEPAQGVRHYVAHFNRRDANAIAALFADMGSLVDPFERTATGGAMRLDGRDAVKAWHERVFTGQAWLALRLESIRPEGEVLHAVWSYMDPNLEAPFSGESLFTMASGEIFELEVRVAEPPAPPGAAEATPAADGPRSDAASTATTPAATPAPRSNRRARPAN